MSGLFNVPIVMGADALTRCCQSERSNRCTQLVDASAQELSERVPASASLVAERPWHAIKLVTMTRWDQWTVL
jgi:hypothetical protein